MNRNYFGCSGTNPRSTKNKKTPFVTANEVYPKFPSTNKTPTEIIMPKFKLLSRTLELPKKHFSFLPNRSIPKKWSMSFDDILDKLCRSEPRKNS